MDQPPLTVSIITSFFNNEASIQEAIDSVASQSYPHIEYIVIDGNSQDNTNAIIQANQNKITQYISEPDTGIYDGLNKGFAMASGDIVGLLHSDDVFASDTIVEEIAAVFKQNPNINILYGDLLYTDKSGEKTVRYWKSKTFKPSMIYQGWMPAHPTLFAKKELYDRVGLFDTQFKIAADYDLILRLFLQKDIKTSYLPKVITKMRLGGASNRSLKNIIQKTTEDINALRKNRLPFIKAILYKNFSKISQFFH
jgi:glycosyltransferase